jgi:hypothetical protein
MPRHSPFPTKKLGRGRIHLYKKHQGRKANFKNELKVRLCIKDKILRVSGEGAASRRVDRNASDVLHS